MPAWAVEAVLAAAIGAPALVYIDAINDPATAEPLKIETPVTVIPAGTKSSARYISVTTGVLSVPSVLIRAGMPQVAMRRGLDPVAALMPAKAPVAVPSSWSWARLIAASMTLRSLPSIIRGPGRNLVPVEILRSLAPQATADTDASATAESRSFRSIGRSF